MRGVSVCVGRVRIHIGSRPGPSGRHTDRIALSPGVEQGRESLRVKDIKRKNHDRPSEESREWGNHWSRWACLASASAWDLLTFRLLCTAIPACDARI